jgi:hypothetical protein
VVSNFVVLMASSGEQSNGDPAPAVSRSCSFCGKREKPVLCSGCKVAAYCNESCEAQAREGHQDLCLKIDKQRKAVVGIVKGLAWQLCKSWKLGKDAERLLGSDDEDEELCYLVKARRALRLLYTILTKSRQVREKVGLTSEDVAHEFSYLNKDMRNLGLLYSMLSEIESDPDAVISAEKM